MLNLTISAPVPDPNLPLAQQYPIVLLAMAIWGESRNQTGDAMLGVGCVVRNRVSAGKYGKGWAGVILKPWQFSSFNKNDPNSAKLLRPVEHEGIAVWGRCYGAADLIYNGAQPDNTGSAVFYYSLPLTGPPPAWGNVEKTVSIGGLHFYKEV